MRRIIDQCSMCQVLVLIEELHASENLLACGAQLTIATSLVKFVLAIGLVGHTRSK